VIITIRLCVIQFFYFLLPYLPFPCYHPLSLEAVTVNLQEEGWAGFITAIYPATIIVQPLMPPAAQQTAVTHLPVFQ